MKKKIEWAYAIQMEGGTLARAYDVQMLYRTKKAAEPNVNNKQCKIVKVELRVLSVEAGGPHPVCEVSGAKIDLDKRIPVVPMDPPGDQQRKSVVVSHCNVRQGIFQCLIDTGGICNCPCESCLIVRSQ